MAAGNGLSAQAAAQEKRDKNRIEDGPYYYRAERRISLRMGAFRNLF